MSHSENVHSKRKGSVDSLSKPPRNDQVAHETSRLLSGLYGLLLTITGIAMALVPIVTLDDADVHIARSFDSIVIIMAVLWLLFAFSFVFRAPDNECFGQSKAAFRDEEIENGSMYLKGGAAVFAAGGIIYSCLDIANFAENVECMNAITVVNACLSIVLVVGQLYMIIAKSKYRIVRHTVISQFGLMHIIALDLIFWARAMLTETMESILQGEETGNSTSNSTSEDHSASSVKILNLVGASSRKNKPECANSTAGEDHMAHVIEKASMFLFPCIIEYTLTAASILYIMWQHVGPEQSEQEAMQQIEHRQSATLEEMRSRKEHQTKEGRDLRTRLTRIIRLIKLMPGIGIIAITIADIIVYFIVINSGSERSDQQSSIITLSLDITHNVLGIICVAYGFVYFAKSLRGPLDPNPSQKLDDGLLLFGMIGVYAYSILNVIGVCHPIKIPGTEETVRALNSRSVLSLVSPLVEIIESTFQTMFILRAGSHDISHPGTLTSSSDKEKGRRQEEVSLFVIWKLIILNLAMWVVDTFCTIRIDTHPTVKIVYGHVPYAIMIHFTMPLVIFYRFHSTVCLFDIWTRAREAIGQQEVNAPSNSDVPAIRQGAESSF